MPYILGLSGLFSSEHDDYPPGVAAEFYHDSAAALVADGRVVAAVEEERFNREKHTNAFPLTAVSACLKQAGIAPDEIGAVAYFFEEGYTDAELMRECVRDPSLRFRPSRQVIQQRLSGLGRVFRPDQVHFVNHHLTHARAAYRDSGADTALVSVIDGNGETDGVSFYAARGGTLTRLRSYPREHSLGHFYTALTRFIGYRSFDEYKVMGLAPYGEPGRFRELLSGLYQLEDDGGYRLDTAGLEAALFAAGLSPRRTADPFLGIYADLATAGQKLLEDIALHLVRYWQEATELPTLCMAGGVAQNTSLNGRVLELERFAEVFVHPASHDGGAALGAAYEVEHRLGAAPRRPRPLAHAYLGPAIEEDQELLRELEAWSDFVRWEKPTDIAGAAADRLAAGDIVGWAQGRSEFGPRALGNRSILADPRPAANRGRVNDLVKQREEYRPLAPAVLDTRAGKYFVLPGGKGDHSYMGFVVDVRHEYRDRLAAITHIDGTARLQTVGQTQNPLFWRLIERFGELTGLPVLLNTSFNNNAEPIVQSARDVITCLLTTGLPCVALGPYLVTKRETADTAYLNLAPALPAFCFLESRHDANGEHIVVRGRHRARREATVSRSVADLIGRTCSGKNGPAASLLAPSDDPDRIAAELRGLWERRLVALAPAT
ncbi:carbamoyltransferase [Streptomyces canus]|uniref:carbamoyltransferase family protein n=1 Tax=Streptomyces canus TaxID=58343 RepID=UPI0037129109